MKKMIFAVLFLAYSPITYAGQSTIFEAEGQGCTNLDTSRRQADHLAEADAKRNAMEQAGTHVKTSTLVKDFEVQSDLVQSFAHASVKLIKRLSEQWQQSGKMDSCLHLRIQAEVIPDPAMMKKVAKKTADNPNAPLNVQIWVDQKDRSYRKGEKMMVYLKGNKPFYGRLMYQDASGQLIQLLPNPYRQENYFNGGSIYAVPTGKDRFELEVSSPFGTEKITVYASTAPGGELKLENAGAVYAVETAPKDIGFKIRGITLKKKGIGASAKSIPAEFSESFVVVHTAR